MKVIRLEQHWYAAVPLGQSAARGFQTVGHSAGLHDVQALEAHCAYQRPPGQREEPYPVSYGWFVLPDGRACIHRIGYSGTDEAGRPGNFLAHNLIAAMDDLALIDFDIPALIRHVRAEDGFIRHHDQLYKRWGKLRESLRGTDPLEVSIESIQRHKTDSLPDTGLSEPARATLLRALFAAPRECPIVLVASAVGDTGGWPGVDLLFTLLPAAHRRALTFSTYEAEPLGFLQPGARGAAPHRRRRLMLTTQANDVRAASSAVWLIYSDASAPRNGVPESKLSQWLEGCLRRGDGGRLHDFRRIAADLVSQPVDLSQAAALADACASDPAKFLRQAPQHLAGPPAWLATLAAQLVTSTSPSSVVDAFLELLGHIPKLLADPVLANELALTLPRALEASARTGHKDGVARVLACGEHAWIPQQARQELIQVVATLLSGPDQVNMFGTLLQAWLAAYASPAPPSTDAGLRCEIGRRLWNFVRESEASTNLPASLYGLLCALPLEDIDGLESRLKIVTRDGTTCKEPERSFLRELFRRYPLAADLAVQIAENMSDLVLCYHSLWANASKFLPAPLSTLPGSVDLLQKYCNWPPDAVDPGMHAGLRDLLRFRKGRLSDGDPEFVAIYRGEHRNLLEQLDAIPPQVEAACLAAHADLAAYVLDHEISSAEAIKHSERLLARALAADAARLPWEAMARLWGRGHADAIARLRQVPEWVCGMRPPRRVPDGGDEQEQFLRGCSQGGLSRGEAVWLLRLFRLRQRRPELGPRDLADQATLDILRHHVP